MYQYIDHVAYFNRIDSHHLNEYTILYVFRAPGYDLLILLSWYKQALYEALYKALHKALYKALRTEALREALRTEALQSLQKRTGLCQKP